MYIVSHVTPLKNINKSMYIVIVKFVYLRIFLIREEVLIYIIFYLLENCSNL